MVADCHATPCHGMMLTLTLLIAHLCEWRCSITANAREQSSADLKISQVARRDGVVVAVVAVAVATTLQCCTKVFGFEMVMGRATLSLRGVKMLEVVRARSLVLARAAFCILPSCVLRTREAAVSRPEIPLCYR